MTTNANRTPQIGGLTMAQAQATLLPWKDRAAPIQPAEYASRLEHARQLMRERGDDALLITAGSSLRYFTGITRNTPPHRSWLRHEHSRDTLSGTWRHHTAVAWHVLQ
ncbi:hypothetical protein CS053_07835 [Rhodanobacter glycinis]|uniref:Creatinase N-terminal domain-containing protein n=2 Tax=Rhodanobacter glycinis TaxID=582702 RepID=A0A5B9E1L7_9GAMM|nr:hypothetical protein CS053_07835 [Rhodanobacter glycinis]